MNLFVAIRVFGDRAITSASGFGFPGRFLFFLGGLVVTKEGGGCPAVTGGGGSGGGGWCFSW